MFVDDVFLFSKATFSNLKTILAAFETYGHLSGQRVNWDKSYIYLGSGVHPLMCYRMLDYTPIWHGGESLMYLGVPIFKGPLKVRHLKNVLRIRFCERLILGRERFCHMLEGFP